MKTKTKLHVLAVLGSCLVGACSAPPGDGAAASSQAPKSADAPPALVPADNPQAARAAFDVLARVRDVVATGRATHLGFSSPGDLDGATLGQPIPVYFVNGADLLARIPGTDPHAALGAPRELVYPILVKGVVASEVVMAKDASGAWAVFSVGGAETIRPIDQTTRALAASGEAPRVALIEANDIGVKLLAHEAMGEVTFTAFDEMTSAGLAVGAPIPAEAAFSAMAAHAGTIIFHPTDSCSGLPGEP